MNQQEIQTDCYQVGFSGDEQNPTVRELRLQREGRIFLINVTTANHLEDLRTYNRQFDPQNQLDERLYVVDQLPSVGELCQQLSQIPLEQLQPYLTEQTSK